MTLPASGPLAMTDIQTEFGGTNPIGLNEYYAGGGLVPAGTSGTYGAVPSSGALSIQNFYGTSNYIPVYIEELFSTYLYTGNGSTQTITNGIDLAGKGGLVWIKPRVATTTYPANHILTHNPSSSTGVLNSNSTQAGTSGASVGISGSLLSTGFSLTSDGSLTHGVANQNNVTYASWTFRKQPKFFDVVTYTGNGSTQNISHNLGSVPGCMIVKRTDTTGTWAVYHRSLATNERLILESTAATDTSATTWNNTAPTSTVFSVGFNTATNASGGTYVAYLFAHDAGGFGLTGTDNVISCGSYTGNGSTGLEVTLGYEPQFVLIKNTSDTGNWIMLDTMRGWSQSNDSVLFSNLSSAESTSFTGGFPTATGFSTGGDYLTNASGNTYIYIAIRRGPMEVPTTGTSVFAPVAQNAASNAVVSTGFPVDLGILSKRDGGLGAYWLDRLRGGTSTSTIALTSTTAAAEYTNPSYGVGFANNTAIVDNFTLALGGPGSYVFWNFRRAPGFFDEVCYTGNGPGTQVVNHNLTVVPELVINKVRSTTSGWTVFQGDTTALTGFLRLNETSAQGGDTLNVSSTTITVDSTIGFGMNTSGQTYVTYLFASCPGVSKVGSYTGTGATQVINCGFSAGARFVLIKSTSTTGDWYVWDSARGIVAGNDPYLTLNTTAAEVTSTDWVDTAASGFELSNAGGNLANSNGVTYIFLAIA